MVKDNAVIFDATNRLVWHTSEQRRGNNFSSYGRNAKRFKTIAQAKKYAITLAKRKGEKRYYDKYAGTHRVVRKTPTKRRSSPRRQMGYGIQLPQFRF